MIIFTLSLLCVIFLKRIYGQILQNNGQECRIVTYIPFTDLRIGPDVNIADPGVEYYGYGSWPDAESLAKAGYSYMAAAEMARIHFNERNTRIVPELADLIGQCNITIPGPIMNSSSVSQDGSYYFDSAYDRPQTVQQFQDLLVDMALRQGTKNSSQGICAVISPPDNLASQGISVFTESLQIPQVAYATIGFQLAFRHEYPTFARVITEANAFAVTMPQFFRKREAVALVYQQSDYSASFIQPITETTSSFDNFILLTNSFRPSEYDTIRVAMTATKERGFRTIVLIIDKHAVLDDIARVANDLNMLGEGYLYIITGHALPPAILSDLKYEINSPVDRMLRGAALFTNYDRFVYYGEQDQFLQAWREQDGISTTSKLNTIQPMNKDGKPFYLADPNFFHDENPTEYSSFMYDSVMATGISACKAQMAGKEPKRPPAPNSSAPNGPPPKGSDLNGSAPNNSVPNGSTPTAPNGTAQNGPSPNESAPDGIVTHHENLQHVNQLLREKFHGASGLVSFRVDKNPQGETVYTNSRDPPGQVFGIYNIRPGTDVGNNMRSYKAVLTHLYTEVGKSNDSRTRMMWKPVNGTRFLFFDGTTNEPMPLRDTIDAHYIGKGIQVTGITLASFALFLSVVTCIWVFMNRNERLIKASQPEFLYFLCFGAALVAPSVIFLSFDEDKGLDKDQLDVLCSAFPWFFVVGYLTMYCALFSKLWRLSQVMQLRRHAIKIKQVILPFSVLIACSILVLVVWQIVSPFEWERKVISQPEEPYETYGECASVEHGLLPFILPLGALIFLAVGLTAYFSWKMRDVQSELSESRWIFAGIFIHIQTWIVGIPIVYITDEVSRDASYLMMAVLAFTFSTTLVGLVIWPKMFVVIRNKYFGEAPKTPKTYISSVTGAGNVRVSGLSSGTGNGSLSGVLRGSSTKLSEKPESPRSSNTEGIDKKRLKEIHNLENRVRELESLLEESENRFNASFATLSSTQLHLDDRQVHVLQDKKEDQNVLCPKDNDNFVSEQVDV